MREEVEISSYRIKTLVRKLESMDGKAAKDTAATILKPLEEMLFDEAKWMTASPRPVRYFGETIEVAYNWHRRNKALVDINVYFVDRNGRFESTSFLFTMKQLRKLRAVLTCYTSRF